jgi:hypothetical protein
VERYCEHSGGDASVWHKERANIGHLAAAAWLSGGVALEEYHAKKGRGNSRYDGRVDLYLRTRAGAKYIVEAKCGWLRLMENTSCQIVTRRVERVMETAFKDAQRTQMYQPRHHRVAITFVKLRVAMARDGDVDERISCFVRGALDSNCDFLAWAPLRRAVWVKSHHYCGLAAIGRIV